MAATEPRDDNLRLVLAPAEKKKIDDLWRTASIKLVVAFAIVVVAVACFWVRDGLGDAYDELPNLVQAAILILPGIAMIASPLVVVAAAWDAVKAWRFRREFEAFHRAYGRDPGAVKMPKSWKVE